MSLAREYTRAFKRNLLHFPTWSPLIDTFEVGDYGAFRQGVFQKLGNIREFGVDPGARTSATKVRFSFSSAGAVVARGGVEATGSGMPQGASATLEIGFQGEEAFFVRTRDLTVMEMPAVDEVAFELVRKRDASGRQWKQAWRVVRKVYIAEDPIILASSERQTSFTLSGSAQAIAEVELGKGSAELAVTSSRGSALEIVGGKGPIAVDLFRVKLGGGARLVSFAPGQSDAEAEEPELELDDDWDEELMDDPEES
jgi:hypothetical protein